MSTGPEIRQNTHGRRSVFYRGKELQAAPLTPDQLVKKLSRLPDRNKTLIFIPSPLFFDTVFELLNILPASAHVLCIEVDQNLMAFSLEHASHKSINSDRLTYIRTGSPETAGAVLDDLGVWRFRRCFMLTISRVYSLYSREYTAMFNKLQETIRAYWQNKMTLIHMGTMWIKNLFRNLAVCTSSTSVSVLQIPKPAVIIGAGESLEESLETLMKFRNRFFLICVDTALPVLRETGLVPDLLVILETQCINLKDFIGQDNRTIPVAFDLTSHPGIHSIFTGKKYFFLSEFARCSLIAELRKFFPEIHMTPSLGSVGVTSVYLASTLTSVPVFFTGLDFSYIPGKPHARGTPSQLASLSSTDRLNPPGYYSHSMKKPLIQVEDKRGEKRYTDAVLQSYMEPLKSIFEEHHRFYDIGRSGLSTGVPLLRNDDEVNVILSKAEQDLKNWGTSNSRSPRNMQGIPGNMIESFFHSQKEMLEEIVTLGRSIITGEGKKPAKDAFENKLVNNDYIYAHFPETPPLPFQDISFVKRIVISAGYYLYTVNQLLAE